MSSEIEQETRQLLHAMQTGNEVLFRELHATAQPPYEEEVLAWVGTHGPDFAVTTLATHREKEPKGLYLRQCSALVRMAAKAGRLDWAKTWANAAINDNPDEVAAQAYEEAVTQHEWATVTTLLDAGYRLKSWRGADALRAAASAKADPALFQRLLAVTDDIWQFGQKVLNGAATDDRLHLMAHLIPCVDPNDLPAIIRGAACEDHVETVKLLLAACRRFPTMPMKEPLQLAVEWAASAEQGACLPLLLPLVSDEDIRANSSEPLRKAVEHHRTNAIRLLLPRSDPEAARERWLKDRPTKWECIDTLAQYLSPEQRDEWRKKHRNMPQSTAQARQAQAQESAPEATSRPRRRLRS